MYTKILLVGFAVAAALVALLPIGAPATTGDIELGPSCVTSECHGDVMEDRFLHGPVNLGQCEMCHVPIDDRHEFQMAEAGTELCMMCHEPEEQKDYIHGPFQSDCTQCHNPHGEDNRYFLHGGGGVDSCNVCHDDVREGRAHLHGPVAVGECLVCHTPHQSDHAGLLVQERRDLCLACHVDVEVTLENAISLHEPVVQECAGCHDPHGGDVQFFHPQEGPDLCLTCHGDFIETSMEAQYAHAAMTEGESCQNCHAPHASMQQALLGTDTKTLCLSCHSEEIHREDDRVINNVRAEIDGAEFLHGPIREDNCVACHQAHGSDVRSILNQSYPAEFYAAYEEGAYNLCFDCHDRTIIEAERTEVTGFRDGDLNLHYLHVVQEKGRTCRACHSEHASVQPNHVRTEVPFGMWMMPVEFDKTETGGTCQTGCHIPYEYDRVTPELESQ